MAITSVRIEDDLEKSLKLLINQLQRSKGWVINEALREYIAHKLLDEKRWQDTLEALEDIRMGRVVDGSKVHAWLDSWGSDKKKASPKK